MAKDRQRAAKDRKEPPRIAKGPRSTAKDRKGPRTTFINSTVDCAPSGLVAAHNGNLRCFVTVRRLLSFAVLRGPSQSFRGALRYFTAIRGPLAVLSGPSRPFIGSSRIPERPRRTAKDRERTTKGRRSAGNGTKWTVTYFKRILQDRGGRQKIAKRLPMIAKDHQRPQKHREGPQMTTKDHESAKKDHEAP